MAGTPENNMTRLLTAVGAAVCVCLTPAIGTAQEAPAAEDAICRERELLDSEHKLLHGCFPEDRDSRLLPEVGT